MTTYYKLDHSEPGYLSQMLPRADGTWVKRADYYADFAAARAEIERLTKERDEARAQVAMIIKEAVNICKDSQASTSDDTEGRMIAAWFNDAAREIQTLTPADAKAALEAYGLEKVREGMTRAAALFPVGSRDGEAISSTILADMEKLK